jgi:hypothetical protein
MMDSGEQHDSPVKRLGKTAGETTGTDLEGKQNRLATLSRRNAPLCDMKQGFRDPNGS